MNAYFNDIYDNILIRIEKIGMIRLYTFLIFVAIFTIILYSIFVMPNPDFVGKTDLLIVPENLTSATNIDNTVNDMVFVSSAEMSNNTQLGKYNVDVKITKIPEHDIINISIFANSQKDIQSIEETVILSVVESIKKHYSVNEDFTIKIIQKSDIVKTDVAIFAPYILMITVAVGLIAGVLTLFYMIDMLREKSEYDENIDGEKIFAQYKNQKTQELDSDIKDEDIKSDNDEFVEESFVKDELVDEYVDENKNNENLPKNQITTKEVVEKKSNTVTTATMPSSPIPEGLPTTPGNLPVVDVSDFGITTENNTTDSIPTEEDCEAGKTEPTEEELKARLNELLSGKL